MTKRTKKAETLSHLIVESFKLNGALLSAGNDLTKPFGLSSARWQIMGAIDMAERALTVAQIGRRVGLSRQAVQRIINDLLKLEMVEPMDNPDHAKSPLFKLTKQGQSTLDQVSAKQAKWVNALSDDMDEDEIAIALKIISKLHQNINN